jgi:hypothetical protein
MRTWRRLPVIGRWFPNDLDTPMDCSGPLGAKVVVVEESDAVLRSAIAGTLRSAGYRASTCPGPSTADGKRCPLVHDEPCAAVENADLVLQVAPPAEHELAEVRTALHAQHPDLPVMLMVPPTAARRLAGTTSVKLSTEPISGKGVVAAVTSAIGPP